MERRGHCTPGSGGRSSAGPLAYKLRESIPVTETAWDTDTEGPATSNGRRSRWSWRDAQGQEWGFGESVRIPGRWGPLRAL